VPCTVSHHLLILCCSTNVLHQGWWQPLLPAVGPFGGPDSVVCYLDGWYARLLRQGRENKFVVLHGLMQTSPHPPTL
jgi:hypothetical protein